MSATLDKLTTEAAEPPGHAVPSFPRVPRWLHAWAVLTALAALPLVSLGAEVTTRQVGMVDDRGFRAPWHLFTVSVGDRGLGYLIEHGHRLAGFVVGICCIVLALGMTAFARGAFYRSLGWVALAAVSVQGLLGIFRVNLHLFFGPLLATVHGCFAQLVFATLAGVAVLTSRDGMACGPPALARFRPLGLALAALVYVQVVFGAVTRHLFDRTAQRFHVLLAFVVVLGVVDLTRALWRGADRPLRRALVVLGALVLIQPILGVEAWLRRFGAGVPPDVIGSGGVLGLVRSAHQVVGTLLFATAVALALLLCRPATAPQAELEGTA
jgi:cytochrome c oxidase assembly protein subunit 15